MLCTMIWMIVLVHLYGDGTVQVSILYRCSLLVELGTSSSWWSYLLGGLYVGSVGHMTHANPIRSGYHQPTWLVKPFG
jgi:hypothetical protein